MEVFDFAICSLAYSPAKGVVGIGRDSRRIFLDLNKLALHVPAVLIYNPTGSLLCQVAVRISDKSVSLALNMLVIRCI